MNILLYKLFPILLLLTSCASQLSAPIEHNYNNSPKAQITRKIHENINVEEATHVELSALENSKNDMTNNLKTIYHQVRINEDLVTIAKDYGQSVEEIANTNNLPVTSHLSVGQLLRIRVPTDKLDQINSKLVSTDKLETKVSKTIENDSQLVWPVEGKVIAKFGEVVEGKVKVGVNIEAPEGSSIKAVGDGIVMHAENNKEFGNFAIIKLSDSNTSVAYAYMKGLELKKGQFIKKGQTIGHIGMSGKATKPQLYLAIREGKKAIDPEQYIINH